MNDENPYAPPASSIDLNNPTRAQRAVVKAFLEILKDYPGTIDNFHQYAQECRDKGISCVPRGDVTIGNYGRTEAEIFAQAQENVEYDRQQARKSWMGFATVSLGTVLLFGGSIAALNRYIAAAPTDAEKLERKKVAVNITAGAAVAGAVGLIGLGSLFLIVGREPKKREQGSDSEGDQVTPERITEIAQLLQPPTRDGTQR